MISNSTTAILFTCFLFLFKISAGQDRQQVEGFDKVVFHHNDPPRPAYTDFRGTSRGYMTAGWWVPGHTNKNILSWQTASVPEKKSTVFSFIASNSVLPSEISKGPEVKLSIDGKYALTFNLGYTRDFTWKEGEYELKYISKRVEYPYTGWHREFDIHGNSGIYQLSVPASVVTAGKAAVIQVEILPFPRWKNGWFMIKERRDVLQEPTTASLKAELEVIRKDIAVANQQTHVLATQVYQEMLGTDKFEHKIIYSDNYRHLHPADLMKLKNGDLLLATREGAEHISNDGDVIMFRSKDGGKTWSKKQIIADIKGLDEREACGIQLKDGTLVWGIFFNNLYDDDGVYNRSVETTLADTNYKQSGIPLAAGAYIITSKDNGKTWSKPNFISTKNMPFTNLEGPTDAPIEMPDGSIVMGLIGYSPRGDVGNRSAVMIRSTDKGKTWQYLSTMANDPGGKLGGFMEPGITRTKTGRLISIMRNHGTEQAMYATYSDDNGKTWAPVQKTDMIGHPADVIQLSDGRLMATYGIRPGIHTTPGGVRACFSNDNGTTWDITTEVQLRNDFYNWDIGYPESLELPGGKVLTVYYFNLFGKYYLGSTVWKP